MFRARHLRDDRLFDCYVAERGGDTLDPRTAEHLADCADCRARYVDLSSFMGGLRTEADAEIDAAFSPEDLRAQQQRIANRIEHLGHAARVISFPAHQPAGQAGLGARVASLAPRWIAAAAVAGLIVGVGVGSFFQSGVRVSRLRLPALGALGTTPAPASTTAPSPRPEAAADPVNAANTSAPGVPAGPGVNDNDEFLSELELALDRPRTHELLALDELTPRVRELPVSNRIR
jgi:hypothetical protein